MWVHAGQECQSLLILRVIVNVAVILGQFVQELLLLEAQLHREIQDFSQLNQSSQDAS